MNIHYLLSKASVKARPSVLWCYKNELDFSANKKKRIKKMKKQAQQGLLDSNKNDPFDLFINSTNIRYAYYKVLYIVFLYWLFEHLTIVKNKQGVAQDSRKHVWDVCSAGL